jgi:MFS family permease
MVIGLVGGSAGILVVALAPSIAVVLVGWCLAQLLFNALLAAMVAVLPDQVPAAQRGLVAGVLGVCTPIASVSGTFLVKLFTGNQLAMFLAPCGIGGFFVLLFAVTLKDRRLAKKDKPAWSLREFANTFYINPRRNPDFAWAFASRFMFVLAYAFLVTYQAYYLLEKIGSAKAEVPQQIFLGTLTQSTAEVVISRRKFERPPGVPHGAGPVALDQGLGSTVQLDLRREAAKFRVVDDDHLRRWGRGSLTDTCRPVQPPLGVPQPGLNVLVLAAS